MGKTKKDLIKGTLELLILRVLHLQPMHGWGIAKRIQQRSRDVLTINQGSLYPALYRLQDRGLIRSSWGDSEDGRKVKVYHLLDSGRRQLEVEEEDWRRMSAAVDWVLGAG